MPPEGLFTSTMKSTKGSEMQGEQENNGKRAARWSQCGDRLLTPTGRPCNK